MAKKPKLEAPEYRTSDLYPKTPTERAAERLPSLPLDKLKSQKKFLGGAAPPKTKKEAGLRELFPDRKKGFPDTPTPKLTPTQKAAASRKRKKDQLASRTAKRQEASLERPESTPARKSSIAATGLSARKKQKDY